MSAAEQIQGRRDKRQRSLFRDGAAVLSAAAQGGGAVDQ